MVKGCLWWEFRGHHQDKLSIHLVRESVHLSESHNFTIYGCSKLTYAENWETNHHDHPQNDFYEDISYKFTLEWVNVWCMYMNNYIHLHKLFGTFYCDLLLMKAPSYSISTPTKKEIEFISAFNITASVETRSPQLHNFFYSPPRLPSLTFYRPPFPSSERFCDTHISSLLSKTVSQNFYFWSGSFSFLIC